MNKEGDQSLWLMVKDHEWLSSLLILSIFLTSALNSHMQWNHRQAKADHQLYIRTINIRLGEVLSIPSPSFQASTDRYRGVLLGPVSPIETNRFNKISAIICWNNRLSFASVMTRMIQWSIGSLWRAPSPTKEEALLISPSQARFVCCLD